MLTRFRLVNFRSHTDSTLHLSPLTAIVGPTGSGKSNLFKGLVMLQNTIHRSLSELFPPGIGEFQWVRSRWANQTDPITLEADLDDLQDFPGEQARYTLTIADSPNGLYIVDEALQRKSEGADWQWVFRRRGKPAALGEFGFVDPYAPTLLQKVWHADVAQPGAPGVRFARSIARSLSSIGYYHLEVSALKSLGTSEVAERIGYWGHRLPDFIAWTKEGPEGAPVFAAILQKLKELLPEIKDLLVTQVNPDQQGLAVQCQDYNGYITARDLSDGTLFTLGMLAILYGPRRPSLLCLEEPETGLHPRRLRWLFDQILSLVSPEPGSRRTQVLISTHSPDLVNLVSDRRERIQVIESKMGRSRVRPLPEILEQIRQPEDADVSIGHAWATGLYEGL
jgi:energy-coupling factor transporter ATP-binding protein EcfA2